MSQTPDAPDANEPAESDEPGQPGEPTTAPPAVEPDDLADELDDDSLDDADGDDPDDPDAELEDADDLEPDPAALKRYPTGTEDEREAAVEAASFAVQRGLLVVMPTDTVYGIAADAFDADAVEDLLAAKGRGREMPPPVLISSASTVDALATKVPDYARTLMEEFWPGPLTLVLHQQQSLQWDLGDTRGTVAVRIPDHEIALAILERTGPLAVSSANITGRPAATEAEDAEAMLGESVEIVVDAGTSPGAEASTIIDATGPHGRVLRAGALSLEQINAVLEPLGATITDDG